MFVFQEQTTADALRNGFVGLINYAGQKAALSNDIREARNNFWKAYPDGPDLKSLGTKYAAALEEKAFFYLQLQYMSDMPLGAGHAAGVMDSITGSVDGGYDRSLRTKFNNWTFKVGVIPDPATDTTGAASAALNRAMPEWQSFCSEEMLREYIAYASTSPIHSSNVADRFIAAVIMRDGCESISDAKTLYQQLCGTFTSDFVNSATDDALASPAGHTVNDSLSALALKSTDDRIYGMYVLQYPSRDWAAASNEWKRLITKAGEAKVRAAVARIHNPDIDPMLAKRMLYSQLNMSFLQDQYGSPLYRIFSFGVNGHGLPWNCIAVGTGGNLIGLRVKQSSNFDGNFATAANIRRRTMYPWLYWNSGADYGVTYTNLTAPDLGMEVVSFNMYSARVSVLATLTAQSLPQHSGPRNAPLPGSLVMADGWIYATDAETGSAFKLREDGSDFAYLPLPHDSRERPLFWGISTDGNLIGSTAHSVFSLSKDGRNFSYLVTDPDNWISCGAIAPDGSIYFQKFPYPNYTLNRLWKIDPGSTSAHALPAVPTTNRIQMPIMVRRDGTVWTGGIGYVTEFDGTAWQFPVSQSVQLFAPMVECGNSLYALNCSDEIPTAHDDSGSVEVEEFGPNSAPGRTIRLTTSDVFMPATGLVKFDERTLIGVTCAGGIEFDGSDAPAGCIYGLPTFESAKIHKRR